MKCEVLVGKEKEYEIYVLIVTVLLGEICTGLVIFICSGTTSVILLSKAKARMKSNQVNYPSTSPKTIGKTERQITALLNLIALSFLVMRLPKQIKWLVNYYGVHQRSVALSNTYIILWVVEVSFNATNFFLYCLVGPSRKELQRLLSCCSRYQVQASE